MRRYSSDDFTYSNCEFAANASELKMPPGTAMREFEIKGAKTHAVITMTLRDTRRNADNDCTHWIYKSSGSDQFGNDWNDLFTAIVFND